MAVDFFLPLDGEMSALWRTERVIGGGIPRLGSDRTGGSPWPPRGGDRP